MATRRYTDPNKWPRDHSAKHSTAAKKGWAHRGYTQQTVNRYETANQGHKQELERLKRLHSKAEQGGSDKLIRSYEQKIRDTQTSINYNNHRISELRMSDREYEARERAKKREQEEKRKASRFYTVYKNGNQVRGFQDLAVAKRNASSMGREHEIEVYESYIGDYQHKRVYHRQASDKERKRLEEQKRKAEEIKFKESRTARFEEIKRDINRYVSTQPDMAANAYAIAYGNYLLGKRSAPERPKDVPASRAASIRRNLDYRFAEYKKYAS